MRLAAVALLALAATAPADTLVLKDGRFVEDKTIEKTSGGFKLKLEHGEIFLPSGLVADYFREKDGEFVPRTAEEEEMLEKGKVPYRGRWVTKSYRDKMVQRSREKRRQRIEQQKERQLWRNHVTVKTKRFVYKHTLSDDIFADLQAMFQAYYKYFTAYWGVRPSHKYGKPTIHIYHDAEYFQQRSGAPDGVVGWYHPLTKELHFYYDRHRHRFTLDVMFHEGNHMLTHMINEKVLYPAWINEGMAEYFGASRWDPYRKKMSVGHLQSGRLAVLKNEVEDDKWQDLTELLEAGRINATQYSWAWSFCHFLLSEERYAKRFRKFYLALGKSSSVKRKSIMLAFKVIEPKEAIAALMKYLKIKSLAPLQKEWREYITTHLTEREGKLDYGLAAWIMTMYGENEKARRLFRKAIKQGSKEAYVHYGYAELRYRAKRKVALKHAVLATRYDPLYARAWGLRGRCTLDDDPKEGLRLLELAEELDPTDIQIFRWIEEAKEKIDDKQD
jgi:tetratricopeptide (TPR) repeat protein